MRAHSFITTAASLLALISQATATEKTAESDVLSLTSDTFKSTVDNENLILVEFFAPWCGHCKALAPHYEEAATTLKAKGIPIAKVDCVEEADLCQTQGVQGYPTLKVFRKGESTEYAGARKADGIVSYMVKQSLPAVSEVTSANHTEFQTADKIVAVAYVNSKTEPAATEFAAAAEKHRNDYLFGMVTDADVAASAAVTPPAIVVYRSFDAPRVEYPYPIGSVKEEDIGTWIKDLSIPIIDEVSGENYATYAQSGKPLAYLFLDPTDEKKEEYISVMKPVAEKYKSKINFVWIDAVKFGDHAKALNLGETKWPAFVIQDLTNQLKYPISQSETLTTDLIEKQASQYVDGKLEPVLKSEPIPENDNEPVTTLVGKNFDSIVFDDSKDVFVEFYAPWCGHCKKLKPTWDSLGSHYTEIKDKIVIAKMDATENDLPPSVPFRIAGFPTIKFKAAGQKEFVDYDGDRSLESMIAFVEEHAKNNVEVAPKTTTASSEAPTATPATTEAPASESPQPVKVEEHDEL
jgi:protein disulfide-isomerase A1